MNTITGVVVKGNQLGRTIGYPTVNLVPDDETSALRKGVYAARVKVGERLYDAMANIGIRPTIEQHDLVVEAHLFDFSEDIYGETITIIFYDFIREEMKFSGIEELKEKMENDKMVIRKLLSSGM